MKIASLIPLFTLAVLTYTYAETNASSKTSQPKKQAVQKKENNATKQKIIEEKIKEQMKREEKYAKEQRFYQGDEYDLKAHEVDPNSLPDVPVIEPEYDFDITDVYRDDI
jgi:cell division protein FtsX